MSEFEKVESLFHEALLLPAGVDRAGWMRERCQGDGELLEEVQSLLDAHTKITAGAAAATPAIAKTAIPTAEFGAYRAVELVGRGGMSAVYRARRADGRFDQTVALKIMAAHLAGPEFLRRFETERQLLASLSHNNITRLLDGGVSSAADPYLITEYVEGQTLDHYCDDRKLDVESRLRIFLQVCDAVDYAHRNLIVHRDLKPGNILVNEEGTVKLLDFGTASLTAEQSDVTVTRARMLTPRYASPEQLRGERVNIATDVFSLGVVLYELLTGAWPFGDPDSVVTGLNRTVEDVPAKSPSTVITEESAERRSVSRLQLGRILKGDLSPIVLKALEGEPARRYESVRQFAADIENFLEGRPVQARPQTTLYRMGKFLRRRWLPATAAAIFVLGLLGSTLFAMRQAQLARAQALKAEKVNQFLNDMLSSAGELNFDPQKFTVAQMLDAAAPRLEKSWKGDPLTEATLRTSLGKSYLAVQRHDQAKMLLLAARATFQKLGNQSEEAGVLLLLGQNAAETGIPAEAVDDYRDALERLNRLGKSAPPLLVFRTKNALADLLYSNMNRDAEEARKLLSEAIDLAAREPSIPRPALALAQTTRGATLINEGKTAEAEAAFYQALETFRRENYEGIAKAMPYYYLANLNARGGNFATAREAARKYYEVRLRNLGPIHARTAEAKIMWARYRAETGETKEAVEQALEAMPTARVGLPPLSAILWTSLLNVSHILNLAGRFSEAETYAREGLAVLDNLHIPEVDARRGQTVFELGQALEGEKKYGEATSSLERSAGIFERLGPVWAKRAEQVRKMVEQSRGHSR
jgi:serine/threonine protein kinase